VLKNRVKNVAGKKVSFRHPDTKKIEVGTVDYTNHNLSRVVVNLGERNEWIKTVPTKDLMVCIE